MNKSKYPIILNNSKLISVKKIKILLVEDHLIVREAWRYLLIDHPEFDLCGEAGTGEEAIELVAEMQPDVVMMDINLPGISGLNATEIIVSKNPGTRVLIVSMHNQAPYAVAAFKKGAMGYITKSSSTQEVFKALHLISGGQKYVCEELNGVFIDEMIHSTERADLFKLLTRQEKKIIVHLQNGESSKKIAEEMNISRRTVEVHRYHILKKLNLPNTVALVSYMSKYNVNLLAS